MNDIDLSRRIAAYAPAALIHAFFYWIPVAIAQSLAARVGKKLPFQVGTAFIVIWVSLALIYIVFGYRAQQTLGMFSALPAVLGILAWPIGYVLLKMKKPQAP
ncbi:MAG: hypothetical protein AAB036_08490 [Elusimicrobiota bacterium]